MLKQSLFRGHLKTKLKKPRNVAVEALVTCQELMGSFQDEAEREGEQRLREQTPEMRDSGSSSRSGKYV